LNCQITELGFGFENPPCGASHQGLRAGRLAAQHGFPLLVICH
jgi:hypothetical protein